MNGAHGRRVHDVGEMREVIQVAAAIRGNGE
jgi:dihydropteroate synthase